MHHEYTKRQIGDSRKALQTTWNSLSCLPCCIIHSDKFATCQFFLDKCPCSKTSTDVSEQGHLSRKKCAKFHLIYEQIKCVKENLSSKSCSCGAGFKLQLKTIKPRGTARVFSKTRHLKTPYTRKNGNH